MIAPPKRGKSGSTLARRLRERFAKRNANSERTKTESIISLPSGTFNAAVAVVVAAEFTTLLLKFCNFGRIEDESFAIALAALVSLCSLMCTVNVASETILIAEEKKAMRIATRRAFKGRTVVFAQRPEIEDIGRYIGWAVKEAVAEAKEAVAEAKAKKKE